MLFKVTIELGNAAMRTDEDLSRALHEVAESILGYDFTSKTLPGMVIGISDANGNRVGSRVFEGDPLDSEEDEDDD